MGFRVDLEWHCTVSQVSQIMAFAVQFFQFRSVCYRYPEIHHVQVDSGLALLIYYPCELGALLGTFQQLSSPHWFITNTPTLAMGHALGLGSIIENRPHLPQYAPHTHSP
jgi:hypothetical protein